MADANNGGGGGTVAPTRIVFENTSNALRNIATISPDLHNDLVTLYARVQAAVDANIKNMPPGKNLNVHTTTVTDFMKGIQGNFCYISLYGIEEISFYMEKALVDQIGVPGTNIRQATDNTHAGTITKIIILPLAAAQQTLTSRARQQQQAASLALPKTGEPEADSIPRFSSGNKTFCVFVTVYVLPLLLVAYVAHVCMSTDFGDKMEQLWQWMPFAHNAAQAFSCTYLRICTANATASA